MADAEVGIPELPFGLLPDAPMAAGDARSLLRSALGPSGIDPRLNQLFLSNRRKLALQHINFNPLQRNRVLQSLDHLMPALGPLNERPAPGGAGCGAFYREPFKENFADGTALYWEILFPAVPGGNVAEYLYLTACNRAAKGVEALLAYHGQSSPEFLVYDWARPEAQRWWGPVSSAQLAPYQRTTEINGNTHTVLPLANMSYQTSVGQWVNQVWLQRTSTKAWEPLYQWPYACAAAEQHGEWVGSWGPLLEGFQPLYRGTQPMGAVNTRLRPATGSTWGNWIVLGPGEADMKMDDLGFQRVIIEANSSWIARS
jgi:hypothetical protein